MSEVLMVARDLAKVAGRVRSPSLTPGADGGTGRRAGPRNQCSARSVRVRLPLGARMESEPARVLGLAANECAPAGVGFDCSALRSRNEASGMLAPSRKPGGTGDRLGFELSVFRAWMMKLPGGSPGSKPGGRGNSLGFGSSVIRVRVDAAWMTDSVRPPERLAGRLRHLVAISALGGADRPVRGHLSLLGYRELRFTS